MTMIDPDSIQSYYSQLSDQELIRLAKKEGNRFSEEAINYLYDEIVKRGLDTAILYKVVETKDLNVAVAALDTSISNFAIHAKKTGKSDTEILQELTARNVSEAQAALIISRLPEFNYGNAQFENLIAIKSQSASLKSVFSILLCFSLGVYLWYAGVSSSQYVLPILVGLGCFILGGILLKQRSNESKGGKNYWVELLKTHPENIVWIKPVVVKRRNSLIQFYKKRRYQLLTKDRRDLMMILNKEERQIFFESVKHLLPHAHIGYTHEIEALYSENPENLINVLLGKQLYKPIDTFESLSDIENAPHYTHWLR